MAHRSSDAERTDCFPQGGFDRTRRLCVNNHLRAPGARTIAPHDIPFGPQFILHSPATANVKKADTTIVGQSRRTRSAPHFHVASEKAACNTASRAAWGRSSPKTAYDANHLIGISSKPGQSMVGAAVRNLWHFPWKFDFLSSTGKIFFCPFVCHDPMHCMQ